MNTPDQHDPLPFDPADEREWLAQERAMRAERLMLDPRHGDARVGQYRLLARALRHPPLDPLPGDFAAQVARRAMASRPLDERIETWLLRALAVLLALAGIATAAIYGGDWLPAVVAAMPVSDDTGVAIARWGIALAACAGLSIAMEQWRRRAG